MTVLNVSLKCATVEKAVTIVQKDTRLFLLLISSLLKNSNNTYFLMYDDYRKLKVESFSYSCHFKEVPNDKD